MFVRFDFFLNFLSKEIDKKTFVPASKTIEYFQNIVDADKAFKLHSLPVARSMHFLFLNCVHEHHQELNGLCFLIEMQNI